MRANFSYVDSARDSKKNHKISEYNKVLIYMKQN